MDKDKIIETLMDIIYDHSDGTALEGCQVATYEYKGLEGDGIVIDMKDGNEIFLSVDK